jgi:hypothetical protein
MASRFDLFDPSLPRLAPLAERVHDMRVDQVLPLAPAPSVRPELAAAAEAIREARRRGAEVLLMMGAHVIRAGVQRYLIDLMERGLLTCLSGNGACAIHDFELALIGATTESVAAYLPQGRFGLWRETSRLNDLAAAARDSRRGLGETIGQAIAEGDFPHRDISLFAAAHRLRLPFTVHASIGQDIVCEHPNYDGGAWGAASQTDFLIYAARVAKLSGGAILSLGSAVMAPEVFLKALAMARNVAASRGETIDGFTSLVTDLRELGDAGREPPKGTSDYYFRPLKTLLVRSVAGGGRSLYARVAHAEAVPELWTALTGANAHGA